MTTHHDTPPRRRGIADAARQRTRERAAAGALGAVGEIVAAVDDEDDDTSGAVTHPERDDAAPGVEDAASDVGADVPDYGAEVGEWSPSVVEPDGGDRASPSAAPAESTLDDGAAATDGGRDGTAAGAHDGQSAAAAARPPLAEADLGELLPPADASFADEHLRKIAMTVTDAFEIRLADLEYRLYERLHRRVPREQIIARAVHFAPDDPDELARLVDSSSVHPRDTGESPVRLSSRLDDRTHTRLWHLRLSLRRQGHRRDSSRIMSACTRAYLDALERALDEDPPAD